MGVRGWNDLGENENEPGSLPPLITLALKFLSLENDFYIGEKQRSMFTSLFGEVSVIYSGLDTK